MTGSPLARRQRWLPRRGSHDILVKAPCFGGADSAQFRLNRRVGMRSGLRILFMGLSHPLRELTSVDLTVDGISGAANQAPRVFLIRSFQTRW